MNREELAKMWADKFDAIYLLHFIPSKDRLAPALEELNRVGITDHPKFVLDEKVFTPFDRIIFKNLRRPYYGDNMTEKQRPRCKQQLLLFSVFSPFCRISTGTLVWTPESWR